MRYSVEISPDMDTKHLAFQMFEKAFELDYDPTVTIKDIPKGREVALFTVGTMELHDLAEINGILGSYGLRDLRTLPPLPGFLVYPAF